MGKTSNESKRKYNEKAYDCIALTVKKGEKDKIKAHAEKFGNGSVNGFIDRANVTGFGGKRKCLK